jgi:HEAT repeats
VVTAHPVETASARPATPPTPKVTEQQLQSAGSANVAWVTPSGSRTPTVQVQLMSQAPMNIVGAPDDADVQRALRFVLANGQRFESSARMDTLDVLRTRCADPDVRRVVCTAALSDGDPAVRGKALESLQGDEQDPAVQQTLMESLQNDDNASVRVEAINLLLNVFHGELASGVADPKILAVLRDRLRNDSSNYIRVQSAAALRQLNASR